MGITWLSAQNNQLIKYGIIFLFFNYIGFDDLAISNFRPQPLQYAPLSSQLGTPERGLYIPLLPPTAINEQRIGELVRCLYQGEGVVYLCLEFEVVEWQQD